MAISTVQIFVIGLVVFFVTLVSAFIALIGSDRPDQPNT